ncbi:MAG: thiamine pyrophosphate-binding protein [Pseudomonadota bacterium]
MTVAQTAERPSDKSEPQAATVGDAIVASLAAAGVTDAFGVISIHNMPILDGIARSGSLRFTPARGEAGAVNMADAATRVTGRPAVAITSTGTGAGNGCGGLIEAACAGTPMLHVTGQIDSAYLDQGWGFIHEAKDQPGWLAATSKAFYRIERPEHAARIIAQALREALDPPTGPVSIEIPIDIQKAAAAEPESVADTPRHARSDSDIDRLVEMAREARRPLLWLGGGARRASDGARKLADLGFGAVSSVQGRGIVDERHPRSLGSFTATAATEALYRQADLLIVAGSHLRSNETRTYSLPLPSQIARIDIDGSARNGSYRADLFVEADCGPALAHLEESLSGPLSIDPDWDAAINEAKAGNEANLRRDMGPYTELLDAIEATLPSDALWVRDITLSNSIWGNRRPLLDRPDRLVHAVGGGIGQGLAHAIGAGHASGKPVLTLIGDGGFMLNPGELATAVEAGLNLTILLMNDQGYGVIRNIQDASYGARRAYTDLSLPNFADLALAFGCTYHRIDDLTRARPILAERFERGGVGILEVDMKAIGPFGVTFAGPPAGRG